MDEKAEDASKSKMNAMLDQTFEYFLNEITFQSFKKQKKNIEMLI